MTKREDYQPVDPSVVPRFAGLATFMRTVTKEIIEEVDVGLVGCPSIWVSTTAPVPGMALPGSGRCPDSSGGCIRPAESGPLRSATLPIWAMRR